MNVKDNDWVGQQTTGDLKQAVRSLEVGNTVGNSTLSTTEPAAIDVIQKASGGLALMGVQIHNMSGKVTLRKKKAIQVCGEITMEGPLLKQQEEFLDIISREKIDNFQKSMETTCKNAKFALNIGVKHINLQVGGSGESLKDSEHTHTGNAEVFFQSREKHVFVPLKSCELKRENVLLIQEAIKDLQTIEREYRTESDCSTILTLCVNFFEKFGSHVSLGMLHFGGIYKWIATFTSERKTDKVSAQSIVQDTLEGLLSLGICTIIGAGVSGKYLKGKGDIEKKYSENELSKILLKIEPDPPFEGDFQKWKETLKSQSTMFSMISRDEFCGHWCLLENHQSDFHDYKTLADILECVWSFEVFKNSLDNKGVSDYTNLLEILSKSLDQLNKVTDVKKYFCDLVKRDVKIQDFLECIPDFTKQQRETEKQEMRKLLGTILIPLKNVYLPERPKLVKWIAEQIENMEDFPSVLATEEINNIDEFLDVLKNKFLPQIITQQSSKQFITKELSHICKKLIGILRCSDTGEQFVVLTISLHNYQYDDETGGFQRLLDISDIEKFVEVMQRLLNDLNEAVNGTDGIQQQAILVNFIVTKLQELQSHMLEEVFKICFLTLQPCLDEEIKQLIDSLIKTDAINFKQLQLDLQPLIEGDVTPQKKFSLPVKKILKLENERCEICPFVNQYQQKCSDNFPQLLESIKMSEYFPGMLKFKDVVSIDSRSDKKDVTSLPWFMIRNIMMQNSSIYNALEREVTRIRNVENSETESYCEIQQDFDFLSFSAEQSKKSIDVNPSDLVVAVFMCSSQPLKQALAAKLYTCKLAIPIVFPNEPMVFSVGILRSILIPIHGASILATDCPCNVLSFIRIGRPKVSKSKLINDFLSEKNHDTFFNQHAALGNTTRVVSEGVIETTILTNDITERANNQQIVTMVFNLRGNADQFPSQKSILSTISSQIVILTTYEELGSSRFVENWKNCKDKKVTIMLDATSKTKSDVINVTKPYRLPAGEDKTNFVILAMQGPDRRPLDITRELQQRVRVTLAQIPNQSIFQMAKACKFKIDDDFFNVNERVDAEELMTHISTPQQDMLPLQCEPLYSLSKNMKKVYKPTEYKTQQQKVELEHEIIMLRRQQLELIPNIHPFMIAFLKNMLSRLQSDDECLEMLTLWIKSYIASKPRNVLNGTSSRRNEKFETNDVIPGIIITEDMSLEFEHLIREMGQLYETIMKQKSMVESETLELVQKFPIVPAKLLLSGTPFELMNGDLVHVPITWVKAVLNELINLVGDKSCLILSVVGIQSSGKSTLLNIMFGLQLPVGYGRITKGAYVQLVQVDDKDLPFEYILVIDTEGLRAAEWKDESCYHDTEFATFVVGLADINIINISGENTTEMEDVLEMVVHALLRLKLAKDKLNLKQSCLFVHQHMDYYTDNASPTSPNLCIDNLNKKTAMMADELGFADIRLFSDVIDFKTNYVWRFPNLSDGSPPMIRTSQGYSHKASELKTKIIFDIASSDKTYFTISETSSRIEHIWNGILMEDFAFDFRNFLEMKAVTAMDRKYHEMQWKLESFMFEYIQGQKCAIVKCTEQSEADKIMKHTIDRIPDKLLHITDSMERDFESFIDQSNLKKIKDKKDIYVQRIHQTVEYVCKRSVNEVKSIVDEVEQTRKCDRVVTECEENIISLATKLAYRVTRSKHDSCFLKDTFNSEWMDWLTEVSSDSSCDSSSISSTVKCIIRERNLDKLIFMDKLDKLTDEQCMLITTLRGAVCKNDLTINHHISINTSNSLIAGLIKVETPANCLNLAVDFTEKIFRRIETYVLKLENEDTKFKDIYMQDILKIIDDLIYEHNGKHRAENKFTFLLPYNALILTHVSRYCVKKFSEIDQRYQEKHSPRARLEKYYPTAWKLFQNRVDSKSEDVIAADFFQEAIKESVLKYLDDVLPAVVEETLIEKFKYSKYEVMKTLMIDLLKMKRLDEFLMYISDPEMYVQLWMFKHTNEVLFTKNRDGSKKYEELCRPKMVHVFQDIKMSVNASVSDVEGKNGSFISQWIDSFISKTRLLPISKDRLIHVQNRNVTDVKEFQRAILTRLDKTYDEIFTIIGKRTAENICWKRSPFMSISERLWGCCETCPFCNEPCEHTNRDHLRSHKHSCRQHRPLGIADFASMNSSGEIGTLIAEKCNFLIQTNEEYFLEDNITKCQYRQYRTKYCNWEISPANGTSKYWMWFFNKYKVEIAKMNNAKIPKISKEWQKIDEDEALESL